MESLELSASQPGVAIEELTSSYTLVTEEEEEPCVPRFISCKHEEALQLLAFQCMPGETALRNHERKVP
ncbi:hypothetical protein STEG23_016153 [Scotinomys teguina]